MTTIPSTLLIIEDSPLIQDRLLKLLEGLHEIKVIAVVATVAEALDRIGLDRPAMLLLDIALSDGDGFEVLKGLEGRVPLTHVVMLTNYANPLFRQRAAKWGVRHFYDKSTEFDRAIDCLRRLALGPAERSMEGVQK